MIRLIQVDDCLEAFIDENDKTLAVWHCDDGFMAEKAVDVLVNAGVLEQVMDVDYDLQDRISNEFWGPDDDA
jgi:rhodanese-related sulfurtransferase